MSDQLTSEIRHSGFVSEVMADGVKVSLFRPEACGSCQMKSYCGGDQDERQEFEVTAKGYQVGDEVQLNMTTTTGLKAVLLAYVMPFAMLLLSLIIGLQLGLSEAHAGLISLAVTAAYFGFLKFNTDVIKGHFSIQIHKLQAHE